MFAPSVGFGTPWEAGFDACFLAMAALVAAVAAGCPAVVPLQLIAIL